MMKLLSQMPKTPLGGTGNYYNDLAQTLVGTAGYQGMGVQEIAQERYRESGGRFGAPPTSTTVINVSGATTDLLNQLRNGLIDSSASGSFATVNPNR